MNRKIDVPTIFLWINFEFERDTDFLPARYVEKLKEEVTLRKAAGINAPLFLVYRSSFLLSNKSEEIQKIRDLGINIVDYDELIKNKEFFQSNIAKFYNASAFKYLDREIKENVVPKLRGSSANLIAGNRADLIDIIKLELAYNYLLLTQSCGYSATEDGCIVQDFDVLLDYQKLAEGLEIGSNTLFFGPKDQKENPSFENNFTYVINQFNKDLQSLIENSDKACSIKGYFDSFTPQFQNLFKSSDELSIIECYFSTKLPNTVAAEMNKIYLYLVKEPNAESILLSSNQEHTRVFGSIDKKHETIFPLEGFSVIDSHSSWRKLPSESLENFSVEKHSQVSKT
jgi:hypothetical protein